MSNRTDRLCTGTPEEVIQELERDFVSDSERALVSDYHLTGIPTNDELRCALINALNRIATLEKQMWYLK